MSSYKAKAHSILGRNTPKCVDWLNLYRNSGHLSSFLSAESGLVESLAYVSPLGSELTAKTPKVTAVKGQ